MEKNDYLLPGERFDDLERNGLVIIQNPEKFCFGMDAVLLSGFAKAGKGARVLDMCTGTGIIAILLSAKTEAAEIVGLELQEESADMAKRSVAANSIGDRVKIMQGDIKQAKELFGKGSFDVVTCNPPYMPAGRGLSNPSDAKAIARHEIMAKNRLEIKRMKFVQPSVDKKPNMVLIDAVKDGGRELIVEEPIIVFKEPGVYSDCIREVYGY